MVRRVIPKCIDSVWSCSQCSAVFRTEEAGIPHVKNTECTDIPDIQETSIFVCKKCKRAFLTVEEVDFHFTDQIECTDQLTLNGNNAPPALMREELRKYLWVFTSRSHRYIKSQKLVVRRVIPRCADSVWSCVQCSAVFHTEEAGIPHVKNKECTAIAGIQETSIFVCKKCKKAFLSAEEVDSHFTDQNECATKLAETQRILTDNDTWMTEIRSKAHVFTAEKLKNPGKESNTASKKHVMVKQIWNICNKKFAYYRCIKCSFANTRVNRKSRCKGHAEGDAGNVFVCKQCEKFFLTTEGIWYHIEGKWHRGKPPCSGNVEDTTKKVMEVDAKNRGWNVDTPPMIEDVNMHTMRRRNENVCQTCGKTFRTKATLQIHAVKHMAVTRYACQLCSKTCENTTDLQIHLMSSHDIIDHKNLRFLAQKKKQIDSANNQAQGKMKPGSNDGNVTTGQFDADVKKEQFDGDVEAKQLHGNMQKKQFVDKEVLSTFACSFCFKLFRCEDTFVEHLFNHNYSTLIESGHHDHDSGGNYLCSLCKRYYCGKETIKQHIFAHNESKIKYTCKLCKCDFIGNLVINAHLQKHGYNDPENVTFVKVPKTDSSATGEALATGTSTIRCSDVTRKHFDPSTSNVEQQKVPVLGTVNNSATTSSPMASLMQTVSEIAPLFTMLSSSSTISADRIKCEETTDESPMPMVISPVSFDTEEGDAANKLALKGKLFHMDSVNEEGDSNRSITPGQMSSASDMPVETTSKMIHGAEAEPEENAPYSVSNTNKSYFWEISHLISDLYPRVKEEPHRESEQTGLDQTKQTGLFQGLSTTNSELENAGTVSSADLKLENVRKASSADSELENAGKASSADSDLENAWKASSTDSELENAWNASSTVKEFSAANKTQIYPEPQEGKASPTTQAAQSNASIGTKQCGNHPVCTKQQNPIAGEQPAISSESNNTVEGATDTQESNNIVKETGTQKRKNIPERKTGTPTNWEEPCRVEQRRPSANRSKSSQKGNDVGITWSKPKVNMSLLPSDSCNLSNVKALYQAWADCEFCCPAPDCAWKTTVERHPAGVAYKRPPLIAKKGICAHWVITHMSEGCCIRYTCSVADEIADSRYLCMEEFEDIDGLSTHLEKVHRGLNETEKLGYMMQAQKYFYEDIAAVPDDVDWQPTWQQKVGQLLSSLKVVSLAEKQSCNTSQRQK